MVSTKNNLKQRITPQIFEESKSVKVSKDDIVEGRQYLLCILTKSGSSAWEVWVDVWYDSPVGSGLVDLSDTAMEMILLSKNNYGKDWYLLR